MANVGATHSRLALQSYLISAPIIRHSQSHSIIPNRSLLATSLNSHAEACRKKTRAPSVTSDDGSMAAEPQTGILARYIKIEKP